MRRTLVVSLLLLGCSPPDSPPSVDAQPLESCELPPERRLRSGDGAVCLTPFSPGLQPYVIETADRWAPSCDAGLPVPCERETLCDATGCTCACRDTGDCRASAVAAAQMHYAGALPFGVATWCESGRCVWSAR